MGSWAIFRTLRTLETGMSIRFAISSEVGSRPSYWTRARDVRMSLLIAGCVMKPITRISLPQRGQMRGSTS
jgi:hypothetical protein